jgi:hypothetical protein
MRDLSRVREKQTLGSETSQYQEEKKPTGHLGRCAAYGRSDRDSGISLVAASEKERAQTVVRKDCGVVRRQYSILWKESYQ